MYEPGKPLAGYGGGAEKLVEAMHGADALILHGRVPRDARGGDEERAGFRAVSEPGREALLRRQGRRFGRDGRRGMAGANTTGALVNVVHALRGTVAPLTVAVPQAWRFSDKDGNITDDAYGGRLESLGRLVVDLASKLAPGRDAERVLRASA